LILKKYNKELDIKKMTEVDIEDGIIRRVLIVCNLSYDMGKDELKNKVAYLLNLSSKEDMNDYIYKLEKQKEDPLFVKA